MSCRCPGAASEVQIGSPSGRMIAWMLAPKSRCLPEYQASIVSPFDAGRGLGEAVGDEQLPVEDHVRPALVGDAPQRRMQIRDLHGEHGAPFRDVAGRGGPPYPAPG